MYEIYEKDGFIIYTDPAKADIAAIHRYLSLESYWAQQIPREVVEKAVQHSLCFSLYQAGQQVGFARVITDQATFAYLCDVYVLPDFRGQGLFKWMMEYIENHEALKDLRRFMLSTKDAHHLYAQFGFKPLSAPERLMEKLNLRSNDPKPVKK